MKIRLNRKQTMSVVVSAALFLCGCGDNNNLGIDSSKIIQEETVYIKEPLSLPEYDSLDTVWSDGSDLYYIAGKHDNGSGQYQSDFYILKQGAGEPEALFTLPENQTALHMTS